MSLSCCLGEQFEISAARAAALFFILSIACNIYVILRSFIHLRRFFVASSGNCAASYKNLTTQNNPISFALSLILSFFVDDFNMDGFKVPEGYKIKVSGTINGSGEAFSYKQDYDGSANGSIGGNTWSKAKSDDDKEEDDDDSLFFKGLAKQVRRELLPDVTEQLDALWMKEQKKIKNRKDKAAAAKAKAAAAASGNSSKKGLGKAAGLSQLYIPPNHMNLSEEYMDAVREILHDEEYDDDEDDDDDGDEIEGNFFLNGRSSDSRGGDGRFDGAWDPDGSFDEDYDEDDDDEDEF
jgi:hypothetical protein